MDTTAARLTVGTVGIDPGKTGGVAVLEDGAVVALHRADGPDGYWRTPPKAEPSPADVLPLLHGLRAAGMVVIEAPAWFAGGGRSMSAGVSGRLGIEHGVWRGVLAALGIPYVVLTPQQWRAKLALPANRDPKLAVQSYVLAAYPGVALVPKGARKAHDGLADALAMAEVAWRMAR